MFEAYLRRAIENGEPIFKKRFKLNGEHDPDDIQEPKLSLAAFRNDQKDFLFSCNYLNNPVDESLLEFKRYFFKEYEQTPETMKRIMGGFKVLSLDPALKLKETADDSGIVLTSTDEDGFVYVLEACAFKGTIDTTIKEVIRLIEQYKPDVFLIETVGFQQFLAEVIKKELFKKNLRVRLEQYNPGTKETKAVRIRALIPHYANGRIFHRTGLHDLVDQLVEFPRGIKDDIIDSLASQINFWKAKSGKNFQSKIDPGSIAWWDALRKYNVSGGDGIKELFKDLKPQKPIFRRRGW